MKTTFLTLATLFLLVPATPSQEAKPTIQKLAWLTGCWENTRGARFREEIWIKPAGGAMLGLSRSINNDKMTEYEFLRLHEDKGEIYYTAKPSGQAEASFKLVSLKEGEAVFENPAHDFPQRVIYRRKSDTELAARIEGKMNGQERGIDFPFTQGKCERAFTR